MMSTDHIRTVVESFYADIWNRHDKWKIPALLCIDFTFRGSLGQAKTGHDGFGLYVDFVHEARGAESICAHAFFRYPSQ